MSLTPSIPTTARPDAPLSRAWLTVALLCVAGCLNYLDRTMIVTMRESVVKAIPMTNAQFGLLTSVFLWVYGLLSPFAGFMADKFNRSKMIIGSLLVWSAVTLLTAYVKTYDQLLFTRALMGISEACYLPAALALIIDYHRGATRSTATGFNIAGVMAGQSLGFVGGWMAERYSWTTGFSVFGIIGIAYSILLMFTLQDAPGINAAEQKGSFKTGVRFGEALNNIFGRRAFLLTLIYFSLLSIVGWMILGWLPTYYRERYLVSQTMAGVYATAYVYPAALVGVITGGYLADRWSKRNSKARILLPVIGLLLAAPFVFTASSTGILPVAITCFMFFVFTRSFTDANLMPILYLIIDSRYLATAYGVLNLFACVIGGIGIYAAGWLRDSNVQLSTVFQCASVLMIVSAGLLYLVKPPQAGSVQPIEKTGF